jgi:hypothetical protein
VTTSGMAGAVASEARPAWDSADVERCIVQVDAPIRSATTNNGTRGFTADSFNPVTSSGLKGGGFL